MEKARILIVEDEAIIAMEIERQLQNLGYEVISIVDTGEKAIKKAEADKPDLIMMDIRIKGEMDGIDTAEIIRKQFGIPVIFSTAYLDEERIERAKITMPFGYVMKPIRERDLKVTIEMALYVSKADRERKKTEEYLHRNEALLNTTQQMAKIGGWEIDLENGINFWTDELYGIHDLESDRFTSIEKRDDSRTKQLNSDEFTSVDEAIKLSVMCYHPDDQQKINDAFKKCKEEAEPYDLELPFTTTKGHKKWVRSITKPVMKDDKVVKVTGFLADITERKQTEEALKKSEREFRQLVENSLVGILIIRDNRIIYQNPEYEKITQTCSENRQDGFYERILPEDRGLVEDSFRKILNRETKTISVHFRFIARSEEKVEPVEKRVQSLVSLIEYQGEDALLVNITDVTKMYNMEQYVNIQEKMSALGRISAGIAHEIRNPLTGVNTYLYSLKNIFDQGDIDFEKENLAKHLISQIEIASRKIESVIKRTIDFAKSSTPRFASTDINNVINEVIALSTNSLCKADIKLKLSLAEDLPVCFADPHLIEQVILNLVNNAVRAIDKTDTEKIIEIHSMVANDSLIVKVDDSGHGVKPEIRHKLFDPFFSTSNDGSGIGLSIVHRIVTDHGGRISISESKYGGARFQIELPIEKRKRNQ
jgi:PAS domain S-box-containing protein